MITFIDLPIELRMMIFDIKKKNHMKLRIHRLEKLINERSVIRRFIFCNRLYYNSHKNANKIENIFKKYNPIIYKNEIFS